MLVSKQSVHTVDCRLYGSAAIDEDLNSYLLEMLGKRKSSAPPPLPKKRRKPVPTIEEIQFDASAREDYLTGFHKRKLQRIKNAREEAAKKEREERIEARKLVCSTVVAS